MLKLRQGSRVPFPEKLFECYTVSENRWIANVGCDKLLSVMEHFIDLHDEPVFFILELPSRLEAERGPLHKDVYYLDGCTQAVAKAILQAVGSLLIADGMCAFGFGGHESGDEIMAGKYNVVELYGSEPSLYEGFFDAHGIARTRHFVCAWDTFSRDHPGESERVVVDGRTVYDIPAQLSEAGMYFAERREER